MQPDALKHTQELLAINQRKLQVLEKQAATFGAFTPPYIQLELDSTRTEIQRLEQLLGTPKQQLPDSVRAHAPFTPQFLDFELEIGEGSGTVYAVVGRRWPSGEAHGTLHMPFDAASLTDRLQTLRHAIAGVNAGSSAEQDVVAFGRKLFEALMTGDMRSLYDGVREQARREGKRVRLRLRIQPAALATLPWELLYDQRRGEFVCLNGTVIVRYLDLPDPVQAIHVTSPLRILAMAAAPKDQPPLNLPREQRRINAALQPLGDRNKVELHWLEGQTWRDLQRAMRQGPWHILFFSGHGSFNSASGEGSILLADDEGETHTLHAAQLGRLLVAHQDLKLVLLNSCDGATSDQHDHFSSVAATLVRQGVATVVAMQSVMSDDAATEWSRSFFEALADGMPVDAAVTEGRVAVSIAQPHNAEWAVPVLYMRVPDGQLFEIDGAD